VHDLTGYGPSADGGDPNAPVVTAARDSTHYPARSNPFPLTDKDTRPDPDLTDPARMTDPVETNKFRVEKLDNDYATWAILFQASLEDKELWEAIADPQPDAEIDPTGVATWARNGAPSGA